MSAFITPKEVVAFRARDGQVPFEEWLDDLDDKRAVARILARLARVRQGNLVIPSRSAMA
jgi:putative component of toxin-antitoxin plasmid stabilization module